MRFCQQRIDAVLQGRSRFSGIIQFYIFDLTTYGFLQKCAQVFNSGVSLITLFMHVIIYRSSRACGVFALIPAVRTRHGAVAQTKVFPIALFFVICPHIDVRPFAIQLRYVPGYGVFLHRLAIYARGFHQIFICKSIAQTVCRAFHQGIVCCLPPFWGYVRNHSVVEPQCLIKVAGQFLALQSTDPLPNSLYKFFLCLLFRCQSRLWSDGRCS